MGMAPFKHPAHPALRAGIWAGNPIGGESSGQVLSATSKLVPVIF